MFSVTQHPSSTLVFKLCIPPLSLIPTFSLKFARKERFFLKRGIKLSDRIINTEVTANWWIHFQRGSSIHGMRIFPKNYYFIPPDTQHIRGEKCLFFGKFCVSTEWMISRVTSCKIRMALIKKCSYLLLPCYALESLMVFQGLEVKVADLAFLPVKVPPYCVEPSKDPFHF